MTSGSECVFCGIVRGELPCYRLAEDERTLAFLDIRPVADGHSLVIPKLHRENLFELDEATAAAIAAMALRVARALRAELAPDGLLVVQANGKAAGQTVFHYHTHLIPRREGEPLRLHGDRSGDPERLRELAARIARRLRPASR